MDALLDLARSRRLTVIEDAAHALTASYRGRPLGTLGQAGCFSFHDTKNITCGEGGAVAFADDEVAQRAEVIREKGTNRSAFLRGQVDKYTWVAEGSSYVLSDVLAALLDAQLDKLERIQAARARVCARYRDGLADWAGRQGVRLPPRDGDRQGNDHIFYLLFPRADLRDRAMAALRAQGVMATFHYVPLHSSPHGQRLARGGRPLPVTDSVAARLLRLPLHPRLGDEDVERVVSATLRSLA
jgi:dTDP-4-amino-4,6-dideoxygalactose transaminase